MTNVDLCVSRGSICGLLGMNGAGKTTLLNIIGGALVPSEGHVVVDGTNVLNFPVVAKTKIGYVTSPVQLFESLTPHEYLTFIAKIREREHPADRDRASALLQLFDLHAYRHRLMSSLSAGMLQKVSLCAALFHDPPVLLLDEPFTGLDAAATESLHAALQARAAQGAAILVSSHLIETVDLIADRIAVLHRGEILAEGTPKTLVGASGTPTLRDAFISITRNRNSHEVRTVWP